MSFPDVRLSERQLTFGPAPKHLDNNINFSPDGRWLVFDCRPNLHGIQDADTLGRVEVATGQTEYFYRIPGGLKGIGAPSFLNNREVVAIHCLTDGVPYDLNARGGRIIPVDGAPPRWLDSRSVTPPFTPGALRGGTHKHEPDAGGQWVGFTYNDWVVKRSSGSDLRNVGVSLRGRGVPVPRDPEGRSFEGESFSVLLTAAVDRPEPGTDQFGRADGDCWAGRRGYPKGGGFQRARAFRGHVAVLEGPATKTYQDIFLVDVPGDITHPGRLGPLEGTETRYPAPPAGAVVRRLTHTAANPDVRLRGISGHLRASGDGRWIACLARAASGSGEPVRQLAAVSTATGEMRWLSNLAEGVTCEPTDGPRFSPDSRWVGCSLPDGTVGFWSAARDSWGRFRPLAPPGPTPTNLVISPDSRLIAYNRLVDGVMQVFTAAIK